MVTHDDLVDSLNDFVGHAADKDPYMPNGLQVRGREGSQATGDRRQRQPAPRPELVEGWPEGVSKDAWSGVESSPLMGGG